MKIGDPGTSAWTCTNPVLSSSMLDTMRMPFPPPPSDAFTMSGKPIFIALASASSTVASVASSKIASGIVMSGTVSPDPLQGITLTSHDCARRLAQILSPTASMLSALGPKNAMSWYASAAGSFGFSLAWPHPGHTASASHRRATFTIRSTFA